VADLNTLDSRLVPWAKWIYQVGKQQDGRLVITSARRSSAKQALLRADYLSGKSKIPANKPGTSLHEFGLAFSINQMIDAFKPAAL